MYLNLNLFDFAGVGFRIDEVELPEKMKNIYNKSVELWVELLHKFEEAAELISAEKKMRKTMWGQYWSSHQRFFKYLCIASKVNHVVKISSEVCKEIYISGNVLLYREYPLQVDHFEIIVADL